MILIKSPAEIKASQVRLVLPEGHIIVETQEAIRRAAAEEMDLVLVQEGEIPVVKLTDYNKLEYQKQKNTHPNHVKKPKQVTFGPHTQEYDLARLAKRASGFISDGHPTSVRLEVKGRDRMFRDLILKKIEDFTKLVTNAKPGRISISERGDVYHQNLTG